jgi:LPXTG-motif cell wall-anchored protein
VTQVVRPRGELPVTGAQLAGTFGLASLLIGGGWLFVAAGRRRRNHLG